MSDTAIAPRTSRTSRTPRSAPPAPPVLPSGAATSRAATSRAATAPARTSGRPTTGDSPRPGRSRRTAAQPSRSTDRAAARAARSARPRPATAEPADTTATAPFVLLIMVLLAGGLVATLWLSTAAAADSYRLEDARTGARDLSEQVEGLRRDVETAQSAPSVAAAATRLGMVPAGAPAVLLVRPDGRTQLVGTPTAAVAPPAPAAPPAPGSPAVPSASTVAPTAAAASTAPATNGDPEGPR